MVDTWRKQQARALNTIHDDPAAAAKAICGSSDPVVVVNDSKIRDFVREKFAAYNRQQSGSSTRVKRVILMAEPPSVDGHEITDKGYINQRATMDRRKSLVDKLFTTPLQPEVIEIP